MRIFSRGRDEELPQDELDPGRGAWREKLADGRQLIASLQDWMEGNRWRQAAVGVGAVVIALVWMVVILAITGALMGGHSGGSGTHAAGVQVSQMTHLDTWGPVDAGQSVA